MAFEDITTLLGGWEGFELIGMHREPGPEIVLRLQPVAAAVKRCSRCGEVVMAIHETTERRVRDLPILDAATWLIVPRARLLCPRCGPTVEAVPWLDRYARMTTRFAESVARLAQVLPIKQVAAWFDLSWDTVQAIDQAAMEARVGPIDLIGVRRIAIDEFAIQKGHRYATTVVDPTTKRVLWVGRGRRRDDLRPFFELLGPPGGAALEVAVMNMSEAYELETRLHCPRITIVYDLFHVVAKYAREVVDRVRVDETNRIARAAGPIDLATRARRRVIKGTRWLLLRNKATLNRDERIRLNEVLAVNRHLWVVYILKGCVESALHRPTGAAGVMLLARMLSREVAYTTRFMSIVKPAARSSLPRDKRHPPASSSGTYPTPMTSDGSSREPLYSAQTCPRPSLPKK